MMRKYLTAVVVAMVFVVASQLWAAEQIPEMATKDYIIGPGDMLDISVWNNQELTRSVTVLPDGKISYPLIGEVLAAGKTLAVLETELKDKIDDFVPNPSLSVVVREVNSMLIYVIGKVNTPGRFALNTNMNVLQAISMAGGLNTFAKENKIKIFREVKGKTDIFQFEYDDVIEGKNLEQNIRLERGDVVVVP